MRRHRSPLASRVGAALATLLLATSVTAPQVAAISFAPAPPSNLNIDNLGRVAFAGDFDALSLFEFEAQNELPFNTNGSESLLAQLPSGAFAPISTADGYIEAMCPFVLKNGTLVGIVLGGNFTSLGGVETQGIALLDPKTAQITPLPGLSGRVAALYCDQNSSSVYVGGSFTGGNSSNAIVWTTGWTNMPFAGFNAPVTSITKAPSGNVIFGGSFTAVGNATTPKEKDKQFIPISSANVSAGSTTTTSGFSDPRNIVCKQGQDGAGNAWLLSDNQPGYWRAAFQFGFNPTKIRLYNTKQDGRGTKTWRFTALPINGILNLTYTDANGQQQFCDSQCPMPQGNTSAQDFHFVNLVGMNSFQIDISDWYGSGGGLAGIELFEDDIFAFAINDFNQPNCEAGPSSSTSTPSASVTGTWQISPSLESTSEFLTISLTGQNIDPNEAKVVFTPNVDQSGNYSITVFTPGCIQDGTCLTRGRVNITATVKGSGTQANQPMSTELFQTNNFDKYDQIFLGLVDASSPPQITLQPSSGQNGPLTVVAQRVRFELLSNSTASLNGLFEFNPNEQVVDESDIASSTIDKAGLSLDDDALVTSLAVINDTIYVGGDFSSSSVNNIMSINGQSSSSLPGGGLNSAVFSMYQNGSQLYVGGNFTNTKDNKTAGLNGVALYSADDDSWTPLGAGVNGMVASIVPFNLNFTANKPESVLAISGSFSEVLGFGSNATFQANGMAIWVPSRQNWLLNTGLVSISLEGRLTATTNIPGYPPVFGGSVSSQGLSASGAVGLTGSSDLSLQQLQIKIQPTSSSSLNKRDVNRQNLTGTTTGLIYTDNNLNITVIAGHFTAITPNGANISNIILINGTTSVTGVGDSISTDSTFLALGTQGTTLFAGGSVTGTIGNTKVNGILAYDLVAAGPSASQPGPLSGASVSVNAIAPQPSSQNVYIGGNFQAAGSLNCPAVCIYDTQLNQWNQPGTGINGSVNAMTWISNTQLVLAGDLTVGDNVTTVATYNAESHQFSSFDGAGNIPGAVTALCPANKGGSQFWVAGKLGNGSAFLERYDGSQWRSAGSALGAGSIIRGLQVFSLRENHAKSDLIDQDEALLVLGSLVLPSGNVSSALFNGTTFTPFIISTKQSSGGTLVQAFVEHPQNFFNNSTHHLAIGFIVLIALAISLGLIFCITVGGFLAERHRRRREGYVPAPTALSPSNNNNMSRIHPSQLFANIGQSPRPTRI